jgi:hypothetical protein
MMPRGPAIFTEADVTRALKAAQKAGLPVYKYEIYLTRKIVVVTAKVDFPFDDDVSEKNPWDEVLTNATDKERPS